MGRLAAQAKHDLGQAAALLNDGCPDWACFAAQRAAERAVKALHFACRQEAWAPVVARLLTELPSAASVDHVEPARIFDSLYTPAGYPNEHPKAVPFEPFGLLHSDQGLHCAGDILEFVRQALAED